MKLAYFVWKALFLLGNIWIFIGNMLISLKGCCRLGFPFLREIATDFLSKRLANVPLRNTGIFPFWDPWPYCSFPLLTLKHLGDSEGYPFGSAVRAALCLWKSIAFPSGKNRFLLQAPGLGRTFGGYISPVFLCRNVPYSYLFETRVRVAGLSRKARNLLGSQGPRALR